ncbi:class I SAM-dependent methyltransferase [Vibrio sp. WJH972]
MNDTQLITSEYRISRTQSSARSLVLKLLHNLTMGQLTLVERFPTGESFHFGNENKAGIRAGIEILDPEFYLRVLRSGSIGAGESYIQGEWTSSNLTLLLQLMAVNVDTVDRLEKKSNLLSKLGYKFAHWMNKNSLAGSKKNIEAHYDLGNDLYTLFLDEKMLYSSALYLGVDDSLEIAQLNKMERLCTQLNLVKSDQVLEIGTGWGAMAIYMATQYGCHVTTTTISEEQHSYVENKIVELGLEDRITLLKQDYRILEGQFDKIVSIEMIEAVGKDYLDSYIEKCHQLLKSGGRFAIQAITIADQRYDYYSNNVDFIQKYIFPGGFLPSITRLLNSTTSKSQFVLRDLSDIGMDYARTLEEWRERFMDNASQLNTKKYDEKFYRLWIFYLCYCEAGFRAKTTSTVQVTFEKQ